MDARERERETLELRATALEGETRRLLEVMALRPRETLSAHRQFDFYWAELKAIRAVLAAEDALGVARAGLVGLLEDAAYGGRIVPAAPPGEELTATLTKAFAVFDSLGTPKAPAAAGPGASERPPEDLVATASEQSGAGDELEQLEEDPE
jgi:hypothetical protein